MRIGLVSGEYPPDQGGVGDFTQELGWALAALGHDTHVITGKRQEARGKGQVASRKGQVAIHREINTWGWGCWRKILRIAEREQLDVLNVQFQTAAYGMHPAIHFVPRRENRPPVAVTFHDLRVPYLFPKAGWLRQWAVGMLAQRADGVIVTNREDQVASGKSQVASRKSQGENLVRIPIGSNIEPRLPKDYDRNTWRARWGVGPDDLLLGYFGFLNQRKGGEELIETLAELVARGFPARLLLVGGRVGSSDPTNAAYAERVEALIAKRGLAERVHRTGFISPGEVSACLSAVDMCVLPYREGVSLRHGSLHACLAHGRPIVTTRPAVEMAEFRDGDSMLLTPAGDIDALANGVARLADDAGLRAQLERGASSLAQEFTWSRIAARTAEFFTELIV